MKVLKILNGTLNAIVTLILGSLVFLVFLNVVLRYLFDSGLTWSEELARYMFVWVVFLGAVVAMKDKSHIGVDLLLGAVPLKVQKVLYFISNIIVIVVLGIFIQGLFKQIELNKMITGPATGIPEYVFYLAGVVASILMSIILLVQTIRFVFFNEDAPAWAKTDSAKKEEAQS
ncbi:TRAP transporter small permease [Aquibacillus albus]|uniref:TRAP-type C4-dicarboxylate transport system permease small subunit n=1 Tax=Aquibacillus albus TaxID=1168171 RepID=A0ABS2N654_9BACI|nr:TRAP transporter small permease [Aquibacillus albus]MBM7573588.1 TRAP-type C4-dicarboxylate transport system permease small subunit [Aquibacillus albus]